MKSCWTLQAGWLQVDPGGCRIGPGGPGVVTVAPGEPGGLRVAPGVWWGAEERLRQDPSWKINHSTNKANVREGFKKSQGLSFRKKKLWVDGGQKSKTFSENLFQCYYGIFSHSSHTSFSCKMSNFLICHFGSPKPVGWVGSAV